MQWITNKKQIRKTDRTKQDDNCEKHKTEWGLTHTHFIGGICPYSDLTFTDLICDTSFFFSQLRTVKEWYCREFRDAMMADPPSWFQSLVLCEMFLQMPFFFVASYGFFKGNSIYISKYV